MAWQINWDDKARRELLGLDKQVQRQVIAYLDERIAFAEDPSTSGKPLKGRLAGYWRYRVADYRVICRIDKERDAILGLTGLIASIEKKDRDTESLN